MVHLIKCIRNNALNFPEFKLNDNFFWKQVFSQKKIKDLHNMTKNDLVSSVKLSPIVCQPIGLKNKKCGQC